jgi:putative peptidoglycan binding protein
VCCSRCKPVKSGLLVWLTIDKHGAADRAIHEQGSGWLIRIGEIFIGPLALVLRSFGLVLLAAISFLIGALVSRVAWIFGSNAFAVIKSPYPRRASPPDNDVVIAHDGYAWVQTSSKRLSLPLIRKSERASLKRSTEKSHPRAIATTCGWRDGRNMKTRRILSLLGLTLIAVSPTTWAAGHGGGGGGFGGGGFHGGGFGGGFHGGGFRGGVGFNGARFSGGIRNFAGAGPRFSSFGHPSSRQPPIYNGRVGRSVTPSIAARTASNRPQNRFGSTRTPVGRRPALASNPAGITSASRSPGTTAQRGLNGRTDHIAERHDANSWHRDWDRRHAHFFQNRFFVFDDGFWWGLDDGYFPWDYLPYYAEDYYPYDYYADDQPYDNTDPVYNGVPTADPTVEATQERLAQLGYYNGPVDGVFGPATRDALANYQIANQLNVTGSLSPDTMHSLGLPGPAAS